MQVKIIFIAQLIFFFLLISFDKISANNFFENKME